MLSDGAAVKQLLMTFPQSLTDSETDSDLEEGDEEWSGDEVCMWVGGWLIACWLKRLTRDHVVESVFASKPYT